MSYGFKDLAVDVLNRQNKPMSVYEIWSAAEYLGLDKKLGSSGKTPWQTLSARIYLDVKNNENSKFRQVSKRPALFALKDQNFNKTEITHRQAESETIEVKSAFLERDLHAVLVKYTNADSYFRCLTKTVYHEKSSKGKSNQDKWTYPDLIGIHFPYDDYEELTLDTLDLFNEQLYKVYSFEMKKVIDLGNLRSEYFQAVSNSSWANEGYLVAPKITTENEDFMSELTLLNAAFGIGVILLNIEHPEESEIIFRGKTKRELDSNMLDKLILKNPDVKAIFKCVLESKKLGKVVDKDKVFDKVLSDDEYTKHVSDKNLKLN